MRKRAALVLIISFALFLVTLPAFQLIIRSGDSGAEEDGDTAKAGGIFSGLNMPESRKLPQSATVSADRPVVLPDDHGSHPAFRLEWWYLTFVLEDTQPEASSGPDEYGLQFTLFRFINDGYDPNNWADNQWWMGHASLHSAVSHEFEERFAAGGTGMAGVTTAPFSAFIDNWRWQAQGNALTPSELKFTINRHTDITLSLTANGPSVLHGQQGYSTKSASEQYRSYYYSQPFIQANGVINSHGEKTEVTGSGWFDHEWSSQLASDDALGWDWFSLHLDNGDKVMAFRMHVNNLAPYVTGTYIFSDGRSETLSQHDLSLVPDGAETFHGLTAQVRWNMKIPSKNLDLIIRPFKTGQWNEGRFSYYEGRVNVEGTHSGQGFMELTGQNP